MKITTRASTRIRSEQFLTLLLSQDGDKYVFGVEVSPSDTNPSAFDCSELVQWACARLGVVPTMPDGSWLQARHSTPITVAEGISTPGALLFKFSSNPLTGGRPNSAHVAVSQGNGRTIEARSSAYGVGQFTSVGRGWTHAALVPGITDTSEEEDTLSKEAVWEALREGHIGNGPNDPAILVALARTYRMVNAMYLDSLMDEAKDIELDEADISALAAKVRVGLGDDIAQALGRKLVA